MRILDVIAAKRDGRELEPEDIASITLGYASGRVPDYQMSAFLMAAYLRGLSRSETAALTRAMIDSGSVIDLSAVSGIKVDKHSTGGVGDKTTLVVVPILAACGLKAAKMSGRGLGFTGGTLDKLESIPGFDTGLSPEQFVAQVNRIGAAIAGQTQDIVPADKKIYALRDVTATVDSIPLIAASIMSKKIACGSDAILLDVKVGSGAFMRSIESARELAHTMMDIGRQFGRQVTAAVTDMSQPLGNTVGNALEVKEAIETLKGGGPADFRALCVKLSGIILYMVGHVSSREEGEQTASSVLDSGGALDRFRQIIAAQGGDPAVLEDLSLLPLAGHIHSVEAGEAGFVTSIDASRIGVAASILGAGRERKEDKIDPAAGVVVRKKLGDGVQVGDSLVELHTNDTAKIEAAARQILSAYRIGPEPDAPPLIHEVIA